MPNFNAIAACQGLPAELGKAEANEAIAQAMRIDELMERARRKPLKPAPLTSERADELIDSVRAGRSDREP